MCMVMQLTIANRHIPIVLCSPSPRFACHRAVAADSVEEGVSLQGAFEMEPRKAEQLLASAERLLQTWQSSYLQVWVFLPSRATRPTLLCLICSLLECCETVRHSSRLSGSW